MKKVLKEMKDTQLKKSEEEIEGIRSALNKAFHIDVGRLQLVLLSATGYAAFYISIPEVPVFHPHVITVLTVLLVFTMLKSALNLQRTKILEYNLQFSIISMNEIVQLLACHILSLVLLKAISLRTPIFKEGDYIKDKDCKISRIDKIGGKYVCETGRVVPYSYKEDN